MCQVWPVDARVACCLCSCCSWATATPSADISLPAQNTYLPSDFTLVSNNDVIEAEAAAEAAPDINGATVNGHQAPSAAAADTPAEGVEALLGGADSDAAIFPVPPKMLLDEPGLRWASKHVAQPAE